MKQDKYFNASIINNINYNLLKRGRHTNIEINSLFNNKKGFNVVHISTNENDNIEKNLNRNVEKDKYVHVQAFHISCQNQKHFFQIERSIKIFVVRIDKQCT